MFPDRTVLTVETLGPRARLIRLGNDLDRGVATEVDRLIDGQLDLARSGRCHITDLVIDVTAVGRFVPGGLESLLATRDRAREQHVTVHVSGCAARAHRLPGYVREALTRFDPFLTATDLAHG
ncbi:MAG: hypothetical protein M3235_13670 [Actinomycetota bacterium]|nr:hypothetical protein [Actinomycetota bacterium]